MATPVKHALVSPSGAHRWMNCTAAPLYEAGFPNEESIYAKEGTLAHKVCEVLAQYDFNLITKRKKNSLLKKFQEDELWQDEMVATAEFYGHYLWEKSMTYKEKPYIATEDRVDLSEYIPSGFGSCDCVMIGSDTLHITDYKHGKGVPVSAENNPQMRLYALGALKKYSLIYGDAIQKVSMAIVQPRITEDVSEECISVSALLAWGENIKPLAVKAYSGLGEFKAGSWCRFCRGRAVCRARAENYTALEDFKGREFEGRLTPEEAVSRDRAVDYGAEVPPVLSDTEVGDLLIRGKELVAWYSDLKDYAVEALLAGRDVPGWKVVAGKSNRAFSDVEAATQALTAAGYGDKLYEQKLRSLAQLEKVVGKKDFESAVGKYITKPLGAPTLAPLDDKREPYCAAASDFSGVTADG